MKNFWSLFLTLFFFFGPPPVAHSSQPPFEFRGKVGDLWRSLFPGFLLSNQISSAHRHRPIWIRLALPLAEVAQRVATITGVQPGQFLGQEALVPTPFTPEPASLGSVSSHTEWSLHCEEAEAGDILTGMSRFESINFAILGIPEKSLTLITPNPLNRVDLVRFIAHAGEFNSGTLDNVLILEAIGKERPAPPPPPLLSHPLRLQAILNGGALFSVRGRKSLFLKGEIVDGEWVLSHVHRHRARLTNRKTGANRLYFVDRHQGRKR